MESHETKLEELQNLVKGQAELIDELKSKQVELTSALESKQVELQAAIAESKVQAAKELSDVKVALEQSQDKAKVSLAQELDKLCLRAQKGEERQVGLAKQFEKLKTDLHQKDHDIDVGLLISREEFQQFQQSWLKRCTAIDTLLARFEASNCLLHGMQKQSVYSLFFS